MILKAIGKFIDTLPINDLLSQEEHKADLVTFEVKRFYQEQDLAAFSFFLRGVTESGGETQTALYVQTAEDFLHLHWLVSEDFTAEAGTLSLDLYGCRFAKDTDTPECIIRFQLPPVQVRGLPESETILDSHSYTEFLLEVKSAANDGVAMIQAETAAFEEKIPDYDKRMDDMTVILIAMQHQLADLQSRMDAMTPITALTQSEFDALEMPDEGTLYIVTG